MRFKLILPLSVIAILAILPGIGAAEISCDLGANIENSHPTSIVGKTGSVCPSGYGCISSSACASCGSCVTKVGCRSGRDCVTSGSSQTDGICVTSSASPTGPKCPSCARCITRTGCSFKNGCIISDVRLGFDECLFKATCTAGSNYPMGRAYPEVSNCLTGGTCSTGSACSTGSICSIGSTTATSIDAVRSFPK